MGVTTGCGEQEAGVASGSGWNLWSVPLHGISVYTMVLNANIGL